MRNFTQSENGMQLKGTTHRHVIRCVAAHIPLRFRDSLTLNTLTSGGIFSTFFSTLFLLYEQGEFDLQNVQEPLQLSIISFTLATLMLIQR